MECNRNSIKIEIQVEAKNRDPKDISWNVVNSLHPSTAVIESKGILNKSKCVDLRKEGQCFSFNIDSKGSLKSYRILIDGELVLSGTDDVSSTKKISIDAKGNTFGNRKNYCLWLQKEKIKNPHKAKKHCKRGGREVCRRTCESCPKK